MQNLHESFEMYLKLVKLDTDKMSVNNYTEVKRAFYGGMGVMFRTLTNLPDDEKAVFKTLDDFEKQLNTFWLKETEKTFNEVYILPENSDLTL